MLRTYVSNAKNKDMVSLIWLLVVVVDLESIVVVVVVDVETVIVGASTSSKVRINGQPAAFVGATTTPGPIVLHYSSLTVFASEWSCGIIWK